MSDSKKDKRGGHDISPKGRLSCGCCDTLRPGNESQNRTRRERESMRIELKANEPTATRRRSSIVSDHLTEGWPLGPTSAVYMDGTAGYHVRHYGKPGILAVPALTPDQAQAIRDVVEARIAEVVLAHTAAVPDALRSAADDLVLPGSSDRGYYSGYADSGYNEAEVHAEAWLKDRADKIEEGES